MEIFNPSPQHKLCSINCTAFKFGTYQETVESPLLASLWCRSEHHRIRTCATVHLQFPAHGVAPELALIFPDLQTNQTKTLALSIPLIQVTYQVVAQRTDLLSFSLNNIYRTLADTRTQTIAEIIVMPKR